MAACSICNDSGRRAFTPFDYREPQVWQDCVCVEGRKRALIKAEQAFDKAAQELALARQRVAEAKP